MSSIKRSRLEGDNERSSDSNNSGDEDEQQRHRAKRVRRQSDDPFRQELALIRQECFQPLDKHFQQEARRISASPAGNAAAKTQLLCGNYLFRASEIDRRFGTKTGRMYVCGSNDSTQLGIDVTDSQVPLTLFPHLGNNDHIRQVAAGGLYNVALSSTNCVYTFGCGDDGCLGRRATDVDPESGVVPVGRVKGFTKTRDGEEAHIVQIAAGENHGLALSADGGVWQWGMLRDSQQDKFHPRPAGNDEIFGPYDRPVFLNDMPEGVIALFTGAGFSVAMLKDRTIRAWGFGNSGELARSRDMTEPDKDGNFDLGRDFYHTLRDENDFPKVDPNMIREHFFKPKPPRWAGAIPFPKKIVLDVACGAYHLLVTAQNADDPNAVPYAYSSGLNSYGQLGHGDKVQRHELTRIDALPGVTSVAAGQFFSLALSANHQHLWSFGRCDYGQLGVGIPPAEEFCPSPLPVKFPQPVVITQMACGESHAVVVTNEHEVYSWGFNTSAATGHDVTQKNNGDDWDILRPTKLVVGNGKCPLPLQVSCGGQHSVFLVQEEDDDA